MAFQLGIIGIGSSRARERKNDTRDRGSNDARVATVVEQMRVIIDQHRGQQLTRQEKIEHRMLSRVFALTEKQAERLQDLNRRSSNVVTIASTGREGKVPRLAVPKQAYAEGWAKACRDELGVWCTASLSSESAMPDYVVEANLDWYGKVRYVIWNSLGY